MEENKLFRKIPVTLLLSIEENKGNISRLVRKLKTCHSYSSQSISWFEEKGLLTKNKINGTSYHLLLTKKGKEVIKLIKEIKKLI